MSILLTLCFVWFWSSILILNINLNFRFQYYSLPTYSSFSHLSWLSTCPFAEYRVPVHVSLTYNNPFGLHPIHLYTYHSLSGASYWYTEWGDGIRVGLEDWDDANTNNGDGCSYQCNVETGYKCIGGSSLNNDEWTPICGDGLKIRSEKWDYHNLTPGDGWSNTWTMRLIGNAQKGLVYLHFTLNSSIRKANFA